MEIETTNTLTLHLLEEAEAYNRWIFERLKPFLGREILEVGSGIGNLTGFLLQHGRVVATDIQEEYLEMVRNKYEEHPSLTNVLIWDVRQAPPDELLRGFDTIVCSNVLEHVEDDIQVLRHYYELLTFGGRLILLVPALKVLYNHLDRGLGHFRRYGRKELIQKLISSGFKMTHLKYFNLFGLLGWYLNGTLLKRDLLPKSQVGLFNRMVPLFMRMEKILPNWLGQSLIAVGEK